MKGNIEVTEIENTVFNFRGMKLDAVKAEIPTECGKCVLRDKGCYNNDDITFVCRHGYIFKEHETKKKK